MSGGAFPFVRLPFPAPQRAEGGLLRSAAVDHHLGGLEQDSQVQENRHVLDVEEVVFQLGLGFLDARSILIPNLCPASDSRAQTVSQGKERNVLFQQLAKVRALGTRSHDTHLAAKNVEELGKLVQAELANEA